MMMNWGTKLVIGMGLFMAFIITLVVFMMRSDSDDLVDKDYYQKGIEYDKEYARKNQVQQDNAEPEIYVGDSLKIVFKKPATGSVRFLHPSDKKNDRTLNMETSKNNVFVLPLNETSKGHWKLILEWKSEGKEYLFEKNILIN
ncbi:FixH family protein [Daejeonella sp.]|jgi:hypothetical protein|uniref:FixH family protein n=1 Tax=Daejeonella sp. TaxID=2805397 RepID=UPI003784F95D